MTRVRALVTRQVRPGSGVYAIRNQADDRQYIGSTVNLRGRRRDHLDQLTRGIHRNWRLQTAWDRYGRAAFTFQVLVRCNPQDLARVEQSLIDDLKPGYNISRAVSR